jgi:hypothetical protein
MAKTYVATQADLNALTTRVATVETTDQVPGPQGPPGAAGVANIYVQQTDPGPVAIDSLWFQTNAGGDIIAMNVMVP